MDELIITPKTKIFDLLNVYPQLEDVLIALAPPFKKLKNPVLRKTITKITSLSQASVIGGIAVEELITKLRAEVGQTAVEITASEGQDYRTEKPDWFDDTCISESVDISEMLNAGEQPVHDVLGRLKKLESGAILKVIAPFIPAPLIDKTLSLHYNHWLEQKDGGVCVVYFKACE